MLKGIKNIIFDIGGVLIDLDRDSCAEEFVKIGFPQGAEMIDFYHPSGLFNSLERGDISAAELYDTIREMAGKPITNEQIVATYCKMLDKIPTYKLKMLESLRERGFRLFALSNINEVVISKVRALFEADGRDADFYFEKMFLSFEMKSLKPDPEIYLKIVSESGIVPSETLFIDDGERNINAARELGFNIYLATAHEDYSHIFEE